MHVNHEIINEFIDALDEEIRVAKSMGSGARAKLLDGKLIDEMPGLYIYSFYVENILALPDDAPVEIYIEDSGYRGHIIQIKGLEVILGIEEKQDEYIPEALMISNLSYLLEILREKYESVLSGAVKIDFRMAESVFSKQEAPSKVLNALPSLKRKEGETPNPSQTDAIVKAFRRPVSYIWGPPGTGKTKTLAHIVEASLRSGRRTLVVSHSNAAVDEVTEDIAYELYETEYYRDNRIIRLGYYRKESLKSDYANVLMEMAEEKRGSTLRRLLGEVVNAKKAAENRKSLIDELKIKFEEQKTLNNRLRESESRLVSLMRDKDIAEAELSKLKEHDQLLQMKLNTAAGPKIWRSLTGNSYEILQSKMGEIRQRVIGITQNMSEMQRLSKELGKRREEDNDAIERISKREQAIIEALEIDPSLVREEEQALDLQLAEIDERYRVLESEIKELRKTILLEAGVICTTLTKVFTERLLEDDSFDILILDEASMAPMPQLYWSLGKCKDYVVIAGDFLQLPPICLSSESNAKKWFGRNIYEHTGIMTPEIALKDERVTMLDTQYRMHPEISKLVNNFFYDGLLKDDKLASNATLADEISKSPLAILDTTSADPWCSRLTLRSRFNIYSALLAVEVASRYCNEELSKDRSVAIITPYSAQARLIGKILREKGLERSCQVATIHRFQGGESDCVIFDLVEGPVHNVTAMIDDSKDGSNARLLINVALSRARSKLIVIANARYFRKKVSPSAVINKILDYLKCNGEKIDSLDIVDSYFTCNFDGWIRMFTESESYKLAEPQQESLFNEKSFYPYFLEDLQGAKSEVIIFSPFLSTRRVSLFADLFSAMQQKGVSIIVFTRPVRQQPDMLKEAAGEIVDYLEGIGIRVIQRSKMHQKVAIIDRRISWEGSLNILSHNDSGEQMRRFVSENGVNEMIRALDIQESLNFRIRDNGVETVVKCPQCGEYMVIRQAKFSPMLSCPDRSCGYRRFISGGEEYETNNICKECGNIMNFSLKNKRNLLTCSSYPKCKNRIFV